MPKKRHRRITQRADIFDKMPTWELALIAAALGFIFGLYIFGS